MTHTPDSARLWCRDGRQHQTAGRPLVQPRHGRHAGAAWHAPGAATSTLGELPTTSRAELEHGGGYVTRDDLHNYDVRVSEPIVGAFRGLRVAHRGAAGQRHHLRADAATARPLRSRWCPVQPRRYVLLAGAMHEAFAARCACRGRSRFRGRTHRRADLTAWADAADHTRTGAAPGAGRRQRSAAKAPRTSRPTTPTATRSR